MNLPTDRIIEELSRPGAYPHPVESVEVLQTHISVIFLASDRVYKVKKPVDFGFLDFTTLEKRRYYCGEELRLNRRLSPDIYLEVIPVTEGPEGLRFGGPGRPLEYAVVMVRLDENRLLSSLLPEGSVDQGMMERIAGTIANFHREALSSDEITRIGGTRAVIFNTEENFQQIEPYVGRTLTRETYERIRDYTRTFIEVNGDLFSEREGGNWIRDGHGDLHTQHICLTDGIRIFDCIEFNERFRYGDVLVDAAFLAMDLAKLGYGTLADIYKASYLARMGQEDQLPLFNFYACYRAVVRGKVEGFRSGDPNVTEEEARLAANSARSFHLVAEKYARTPDPPAVIAACGLMGAGKTTIADSLKDHLDMQVLSSDVVRKELAGIDPATPRHVPFGENIYSSEFTSKTYDEIHRRAEDLVRDGRSVFLDASYMTPQMREDALEMALRAGARFLLLYFEAAEVALRKRLRDRSKADGVVSDGREEILDDQLRAFQPPEEIPGNLKLVLDASAAQSSLVRETYRRLLSTS